MARNPVFSEYITYGVFIDHVETYRNDHARTVESLTLNSWNYTLAKAGEEARFLADLKPHHVGLLLQSIEKIPAQTRERIISALKARVAAQDQTSSA